MEKRMIACTVRGQPTIDGAGVHLTRVLGHNTVEAFDPFLMLDSFDSKRPADYLKGFPMHPHRGIETVTYLISGGMEHRDSLGNRGLIRAGEGQWMTAGAGILHQEMPRESAHMLGVQLWLNLPGIHKMTPPAYRELTQERIPAVSMESGTVRVLSGAFRGRQGVTSSHTDATIYDVSLSGKAAITLESKVDETVFLFMICGEATVGDARLAEKTAVLFYPGDHIEVQAPEVQGCRFLYCAAKPLREPVAWGGPIVMNTQEELDLAFRQLRDNTFIAS